MTIRLVTLTLRTRYRPVRLPVQTVRCCLRKSNTASKVAKHRDLPSPVGKETKTSLPCRNSLTALSWSVIAAAYPRVRKACLMASFTSSTATPLASSLGISMIDARRTPLDITRSDASFSGNLIGQNDIVLQCQAFRLKYMCQTTFRAPLKMAAGSGLGTRLSFTLDSREQFSTIYEFTKLLLFALSLLAMTYDQM